MNSFSSTFSALALSATLLAPGVSQAKAHISIMDSQYQEYRARQKTEICEGQKIWLADKVWEGVRLKIDTALVTPKIVSISIVPDLNPKEPTDYVQETNIDGNTTKELIRLAVPIPFKNFSLTLRGRIRGAYLDCIH